LPQYKTSQTDDRQTDRQTDRQMTHCTKGSTDSTVGQLFLSQWYYEQFNESVYCTCMDTEFKSLGSVAAMFCQIFFDDFEMQQH